MRNNYVLPASDAPCKGFRLVALPEFNDQPATTKLVTDDLAKELEHLVSRGRIREARTLLSWFDETGE